MMSLHTQTTHTILGYLSDGEGFPLAIRRLVAAHLPTETMHEVTVFVQTAVRSEGDRSIDRHGSDAHVLVKVRTSAVSLEAVVSITKY